MASRPSRPTADDFTELARSSRRRWRTLRFTVSWPSPDSARPYRTVRGRVRRPDAVRVEDLDGHVWHAELGHRPSMPDDDPMFRDYHWVAMLNPRELAVGEDPDGLPGPVPVALDGLAEVDQHGRPAWQADLRPNESYAPRCSCCPLLFSRASEDIEAEAGVRVVRDTDPDLRYADAHRVRLDVATGVCVRTEELGGSRPGARHDMRIETVDEPMPDELFTGGRRPGTRLRWRPLRRDGLVDGAG